MNISAVKNPPGASPVSPLVLLTVPERESRAGDFISLVRIMGIRC
jgi:hypothetical protein